MKFSKFLVDFMQVGFFVYAAGAVYDITKQYDNSFYLAGMCVLISGAMLYGIPSIQRRRREKTKSIETTA